MSQKVWRNSEGHEFPVWDCEPFSTGANVGGERLSPKAMRSLGYELVDRDPEEFECEAHNRSDSLGQNALYDDRLIPGKTYLVREKP